MHFGARAPPTASFFDDVVVVKPGRLSLTGEGLGSSTAFGDLTDSDLGIIGGGGRDMEAEEAEGGTYSL